MLKIDVEGAEQLILQGGMNFIRGVFPFVLIECSASSRLNLFEDLGYSIGELPENSNYLLTPPEFGPNQSLLDNET
jgi:hypothetical protein